MARKVILEVDSDKYHSTPEQRASDAYRDHNLALLGWQTVGLTETALREDLPLAVHNAVARFNL